MDYLFTAISLPHGEYRRRSPHFHPDCENLFVTWRLLGSSPDPQLRASLATPGHAFAADDRALALGRGSCGSAIRESHGKWRSHVHLLILPHKALPQITHWIKGRTTREGFRQDRWLLRRLRDGPALPRQAKACPSTAPHTDANRPMLISGGSQLAQRKASTILFALAVRRWQRYRPTRNNRGSGSARRSGGRAGLHKRGRDRIVVGGANFMVHLASGISRI